MRLEIRAVALALLLGANIPSVAGAGEEISGGVSAPSRRGSPTSAPATLPKSASERLAALTSDRAIGQMLLSEVSGLTASRRLLARIRAGQVGSVILHAENVISDRQLSTLTRSLQQAARAGGNPPLLIAVDQEGGPVKRLRNAPPTMSAQQMGESKHVRALAEAQGLATGRDLRRLGIDLDLAPVADIPTTADSFLGERAFGRDPHTVVEGASGFAVGLARASVAGAAKHFPGLGQAGAADTDLEVVSVGASQTSLRAGYAPYERMAEDGPFVAPLVMISNAIYPSLDPSRVPADLSRRIVRGELARAHVAGRVTITDDLEVPATERYANAAVRAALAGDDILMFATREAGSERAFTELRRAVAAGTVSRELVLAAARRVEALKSELSAS